MQQDVTAISQPVDLSDPTAMSPSLSLWRRAWEGWKRIAHAIGVVQTRIVMLLFFFIFILPLGLVLRLFRDPLHLKHPEGSNWLPHRQEPHTLKSAQQQF